MLGFYTLEPSAAAAQWGGDMIERGESSNASNAIELVAEEPDAGEELLCGSACGGQFTAPLVDGIPHGQAASTPWEPPASASHPPCPQHPSPGRSAWSYVGLGALSMLLLCGAFGLGAFGHALAGRYRLWAQGGSDPRSMPQAHGIR
jgi:hypothetical protein